MFDFNEFVALLIAGEVDKTIRVDQLLLLVCRGYQLRLQRFDLRVQLFGLLSGLLRQEVRNAHT